MAPPSDGLFARAFAADAQTERALRAGLSSREARIQRGRFDAALSGAWLPRNIQKSLSGHCRELR